MIFKISKTRLRIIYWGSFLLFMILVVFPLFFFFYLFDEAKVKQAIIDQFDNKNYNVEISGSIAPKLWHGMSLDLSGILITTKNTNELIKVRRMSCKLSWFNLVIGRYSVNRIAIDGMDINEDNLIHYGLSNLLNITNKANSLFNIEQLEIKNIDSVGKNILYPINEGTLAVEKDGLGIRFNLGFKSPNNNTFYLVNANTGSFQNDVINFDEFNVHIYNMFSNINIAAHAQYLINDKLLSLNNLVGNLQVKDYAGILNVNSVILGLNKATAHNAVLKIDYTNNLIGHHFLLNADDITTYDYRSLKINDFQSQYKSNITDILFNVNSEIKDLTYTESKGIYSNSCFNQVNISSSYVKGGQLNAVLNGRCYAIDGNLFLFGLKGNLNNMPIKLDLQIINNNTKPYIIADGNISTLDLSKLSFDNKKAIPFFSDKNKLPFGWLSLFNAKANLTLDHFVLDRIMLNNLTTEFTINNNQLNVNRLEAQVYNGKINGSLKVLKNSDDYDIYAKQTISHLSLKNMLSTYFNIRAISGTANMKFDAVAKNVKNYDDIHRKISGNVFIEAKNGAFQGVDFNLFVNPESNTLTTNKSTIFNQMRARFKFINGISDNGLIEFSSPYVIANGFGNLNFVNDTLNYNLNIKSALPKNTQQISLVVIPVSIAGNILNPKVNIQNIQLIGATESVNNSGVNKKQRIRNTRKMNTHRPRQ